MDCIVWKTFNMAKMSITERAQALPCTHTIICMHARKHERDVTSKIRPVLLPHIRFNRDMMLANHNTPRTATRSTHVILVTNKRWTLQWPAQSMDFNPSKYVWDILKRIVRVQPLQPNLKELSRVTHQVCHSTTVSSQIHYVIGNNVHCCNCHSRWTYNVLNRN